MSQCLYCATELSLLPSKAHVIPEAVGGRMKSQQICCATCNQAISTVEGEFCNDLRDLTGMLGLKTQTRRGTTAPAEFQHDELGIVHVSSGRPEAKKPNVTREPRADGRTNISISGCSDSDLATIVAHELRRARKTPDDLENGTVQLEGHTNSTNWVSCRVAVVRSRNSDRVFAKMALELLAAHRPEHARRAELDPVRRFVRFDEGELAIEPLSDDAEIGPTVDVAGARFPHVVKVWTTGQLLVGTVRLVGYLHFGFILTGAWSGGVVAVAHCVDPVVRRIVFDAVDDHDGPGLPPDWPDRHKIGDVQAQAMGMRLQRAVSEHLERLADREMVDRHLERLASDCAEGSITAKAVGQFAMGLAEEIVKRQHRLPERREIPREGFLELVRRKFQELAERD